MPANVVVNGSLSVGATAAATIKNHFGRREAKTPINVTLISERLIRIGTDDFRTIIATTSMNGMTNYLVTGSRLSAAEQQRRYALVRANELLRQLRDTIMSLDGASADPELVAVPLQMLFDFVGRQQEREQTLPPPTNTGCINVTRY